MANKNIVRLRDRQISEGIYLTWFMILLQARYIIPDLRKQKDCNNKNNLNLETLSYITDHFLTRIIRQPSYAHLMVLFLFPLEQLGHIKIKYCSFLQPSSIHLLSSWHMNYCSGSHWLCAPWMELLPFLHLRSTWSTSTSWTTWVTATLNWYPIGSSNGSLLSSISCTHPRKYLI